MRRIGLKYPLCKRINKRITSLENNEIRIRSFLANASSSRLASYKTGISLPKATNLQQIQKLCFSSKGNGNGTDNSGFDSSSSPFKDIKEAPGKVIRNAVPISKTPRGQAKARAKIKNKPGSGAASTSTIHPSNPNASVSIHQQQQHLTHFVTGGTPSDPLKAPFRLTDYGDDSLYTLVLLRHGESEWNKLNKYTGWCDVNLTENGRQEARAAGRLLKENGVEIDHVFTSVLRRANFTTNMALNTAEQHWVPITKTWRLNERHYGALQGYNKDTAYEELDIDQELVMEMRRSYDTRPPKMEDDHPYWHGNDRR